MAELRNPIGVKLGPTATVDDALRLIDTLDPEREPGRLTFITRMGAGNIRDRLPALVEGVRDAGAQVAWVTDPRSEEHTSELQSRGHLVCRLLLEKKKENNASHAQLYDD